MSKVILVDHPMIQHKLSFMRSKEADTKDFREMLEEISMLMGYEVLRDMYALAACDGLVAGLSQVVNCARIVKESSGEEYDTLCIINNGINISGKQFTK